MILAYIVLGQLLVLGLCLALIIIGSGRLAKRGDIVSCQFLASAGNACCSSGLGVTGCLLPQAVCLVIIMLLEGSGFAVIVVVMLWLMSFTWCMNVQHYRQSGTNILLCFPQTPPL